MESGMEAITVSQPYATLIVGGEKWIENRSREWHYRGPLLIHAGKGTQYMTHDLARKYGHALGAFVGVARLVACVTKDSIRKRCSDTQQFHQRIPKTSHTWWDALNNKHCEGPYCLVLEDVAAFHTPIPATGQLGLWPVRGELAESVQRELDQIGQGSYFAMESFPA